MPISEAIFVPLTTTVAWFASNRTIWPRWASVCESLGEDNARSLRIVADLAMGKLSGRTAKPDARYAGPILMLMSTAGAEWVSAPTEMKFTPVSA